MSQVKAVRRGPFEFLALQAHPAFERLYLTCAVVLPQAKGHLRAAQGAVRGIKIDRSQLPDLQVLTGCCGQNRFQVARLAAKLEFCFETGQLIPLGPDGLPCS